MAYAVGVVSVCAGLFSGLLGWQGNSGDIIALQIIVVDSAARRKGCCSRLRVARILPRSRRQKSTDPSAASGGYMGRVDPATLRAEFRDAMKGFAPGQITGIIKFSEGYAILKVLPSSGPANSPTSRPSLPTSARGGVRYALNVGGLNDADAVFTAFPKPAGWQQDLPGIACAPRKSRASPVANRSASGKP